MLKAEKCPHDAKVESWQMGYNGKNHLGKIGTGLCDGVALHKMGCALAINASIMAFGLHHLSICLGQSKELSLFTCILPSREIQQ